MFNFDPAILLNLLTPEMLLFCCFGTLFGVVMGAIPGLNGAVGITLLLPLTFGMRPDVAVVMLGGIFMGGMYGGSITAILINVPGDVVAACTAMEGYPMALQGRAKEALYYSIFSSMFGGLLGVLTMIFFTPVLSDFSLKFGPPEMLLLTLCGLAVIGSLTGKNIPKAFFAVAFGLFLSMVGVDSTNSYRFTLGTDFLKNGIDTVPLVLGLFCFSEMYLNISKKVSNLSYFKNQQIRRFDVIKDILKHKFLLIRSAMIGIIIGILPGIGGSLAVFMAYGQAKSTTKSKIPFGSGNPEGIIAAEAANNALIGGAMIPMLALGIPGCASAALISSALTMHGIIPGPNLLRARPDIAYVFMYGMLLTVLAMALIGAFGIKWFAYVLKFKMEYIIPAVIVFAVFGAYSCSNRVSDVSVALFFGIVGAVFIKLQIPISPVIIGQILGPIIEANLRRCMSICTAKNISFVSYVINRPLSVVLLIVLAAVAVFFLVTNPDLIKKGRDEN